jgi:hypothetical protein
MRSWETAVTSAVSDLTVIIPRSDVRPLVGGEVVEEDT